MGIHGRAFSVLVVSLFFFISLQASLISVPGNFPTIQEAIDASVDGDEIIIAEGVYYESINFHGKNILVRSTDPDDPLVVEGTVIVGRIDTSTVSFGNGSVMATMMASSVSSSSLSLDESLLTTTSLSIDSVSTTSTLDANDVIISTSKVKKTKIKDIDPNDVLEATTSVTSLEESEPLVMTMETLTLTSPVLQGITVTSIKPEPVMHWGMNGTVGTTTVTDLSGNGHDGTLGTGFVGTWQPGVIWDALQFTKAATDTVTADSYQGICGNQARTVSAWIWAGNDHTGGIVSWGGVDDTEQWMFLVESWYGATVDTPGPGRLQVSIDNGSNIIGTKDVCDGTWHHVAVVLRDGGTLDSVQLYVDGVIDPILVTNNATGSVSTPDGRNVQVGWIEKYGCYFEGMIDDVRIYDIPLGQDMLKGIVDEKNIQVHYTMDAIEPVGGDLYIHDTGTTMKKGRLDDDFASDCLINGQMRGGIVFDGTDDKIVVTEYEGISNAGSRTISVWVKITSLQDINVAAGILSWGSDNDVNNDSVVQEFRLIVQNWHSDYHGSIQLDFGVGYLLGETNICDGQWHHIAAVFAESGTNLLSEAKLYIDGSLEDIGVIDQGSTAIATDVDSNSTVQIGWLQGLSGYYFKGAMDELRIYNRALFSNEVSSLYAQGKVRGGGVYADNISATVDNCIIINNEAELGGGIYGVDGTISNCQILRNYAHYGGGAGYCDADISNTVFAKNTAVIDGGGMDYCLGTITNCTVADNLALDSGGGLNICGSTLNSIIWGNIPDNTYSVSGITYSCIENYNGSDVTNIADDPLFSDTDNDDYHLMSVYGSWRYGLNRWAFDTVTSPCIDAGDINSDYSYETIRNGGRINMGAYGNTYYASHSVDITSREFSISSSGNGDYPTIQAAVDAAFPGDTIVLQPGTYTGDGNRDIDFRGKAITLKSTNPLDSSIVANTIIDCGGSSDEPHRGFYFHSGETVDSKLDGITIINGYGGKDIYWDDQDAVDDDWRSSGGAILCYRYVTQQGIVYTSPTIQNCVIKNNASDFWGGGIYCEGSSAQIINCTIINNYVANGVGGGVYINTGTPEITECTINNNQAVSGGGMWMQSSSGTITHSNFKDNVAHSRNGGGLFLQHQAPKVHYCRFVGNVAIANDGTNFSDGGGAIKIDECSPDIVNCLFLDNTSGNLGGGILSQNNYALEASTNIVNCTFSGNDANSGGAVYLINEIANISNSILWDDSAAGDGQEICLYGSNSSLDVNFSDIQGGEEDVYNTDGTLAWANNINLDPLYVADNDDGGDGLGDDPATGSIDEGLNDIYNLELYSSCSPCIDAGNNNSIDNDNLSFDLGGGIRLINDEYADDTGLGNPGQAICDMGAYEYSVTPINHSPRARDDYYDSDENLLTCTIGGSLIIDVMYNDCEPDENDSITIVENSISTSNGATVTVSQDNNFITYTPNPDYLEDTDTFTYRVVDTFGEESNDAIVTVNIIGYRLDVDAGNDYSVNYPQTKYPLTDARIYSTQSDDYLEYAWTCLYSPPGTSIRIDESTSLSTYFEIETIDEDLFNTQDSIEYLMQLTITDVEYPENPKEASDTILITINAPLENQQAPLVEITTDPDNWDGITLSAIISDDGLPGDLLTAQWELVKGPGNVIFDEDHINTYSVDMSDLNDPDFEEVLVSTNVLFDYEDSDGTETFIIKLTVSDGELTTEDFITIQLAEPSDIPKIAIGDNLLIDTIYNVEESKIEDLYIDDLPITVRLDLDKNEEDNVLLEYINESTLEWAQIEGPATVEEIDYIDQEEHPEQATVEFSVEGTYVFELRGISNAGNELYDLLEVKIEAKDGYFVKASTPPVVYLPTDYTTLRAKTRDSSATISWRLVNCPENAGSKIEDENSITDDYGRITSVTFSPAIPGFYTFEVTAQDGLSEATETVRVELRPRKNLFAGGKRFYVIDNDGTLWGCGSDTYSTDEEDSGGGGARHKYGALGTGQTEIYLTKINSGEKNANGELSLSGIVTMTCSEEANLVIDNEDNLWGWGDNFHGNLGVSNNIGVMGNYCAIDAVQIVGDPNDPFLENIIDISTSNKFLYSYIAHSLAIDENNNVWGWGDNTYGQLASNISGIEWRPELILTGNFKQVSSQEMTSFALEKHDPVNNLHGKVYAWGKNGYTSDNEHEGSGYLGINEDDHDIIQYEPVSVHAGIGDSSELSNIVSICSGAGFTMALEKLDDSDTSCNGRVYVWGTDADASGIFGRDDFSGNQIAPMKVLAGGQSTENVGLIDSDYLINIVSISCSRSHCLALDRKGHVWTWGRINTMNGDTNLLTPIKIRAGEQSNGPEADLSDIISIAAGEFMSLAMDREGNIWGWGNNKYGVEAGILGTGSLEPYILTPEKVIWDIEEKKVHNITKNVWYSKINSAIEDAGDSDEIVIHEGVYYENIEIVRSYQDGQWNGMPKSLTIRSVEPDNWDVVQNTIIRPVDNAQDVIIMIYSDYIISGLTIDGGVYNDGILISKGEYSDISVFVSNKITDDEYGDPKIVNCIIKNNKYGLKFYDQYRDHTKSTTARPTIFNNRIYDNTDIGIKIEDCDADISGNTILTLAGEDGLDDYGIYLNDSDNVSTLRNNTILCEQSDNGIGISCIDSVEPIFMNSIIITRPPYDASCPFIYNGTVRVFSEDGPNYIKCNNESELEECLSIFVDSNPFKGIKFNGDLVDKKEDEDVYDDQYDGYDELRVMSGGDNNDIDNGIDIGADEYSPLDTYAGQSRVLAFPLSGEDITIKMDDARVYCWDTEPSRNPGAIKVQWSVISQPVSEENPNAINAIFNDKTLIHPEVTFKEPGTYHLLLTVEKEDYNTNESDDVIVGSDTIWISFYPEDFVDAYVVIGDSSLKEYSTESLTFNLDGTVSNDDLNVDWSQLEGPVVSFSEIPSGTNEVTVTCSESGFYRFQLNAFDDNEKLKAAEEVCVLVKNPIVNIDVTDFHQVTLYAGQEYASAQLNALVTSACPHTTLWRYMPYNEDSPNVTILNPESVKADVVFSEVGYYRFVILAKDSLGNTVNGQFVYVNVINEKVNVSAELAECDNEIIDTKVVQIDLSEDRSKVFNIKGSLTATNPDNYIVQWYGADDLFEFGNANHEETWARYIGENEGTYWLTFTAKDLGGNIVALDYFMVVVNNNINNAATKNIINVTAEVLNPDSDMYESSRIKQIDLDDSMEFNVSGTLSTTYPDVNLNDYSIQWSGSNNLFTFDPDTELNTSVTFQGDVEGTYWLTVTVKNPGDPGDDIIVAKDRILVVVNDEIYESSSQLDWNVIAWLPSYNPSQYETENVKQIDTSQIKSRYFNVERILEEQNLYITLWQYDDVFKYYYSDYIHENYGYRDSDMDSVEYLGSEKGIYWITAEIMNNPYDREKALDYIQVIVNAGVNEEPLDTLNVSAELSEYDSGIYESSKLKVIDLYQDDTKQFSVKAILMSQGLNPCDYQWTSNAEELFVFDNVNADETSVSFSGDSVGTYWIALEVTDGVTNAVDYIQVNVINSNSVGSSQVCVIDACSNNNLNKQYIYLPDSSLTFNLAGIKASGDYDTTRWFYDGPEDIGDISIADPTSLTSQVTLPYGIGRYVFTLVAYGSDGTILDSDNVTYTMTLHTLNDGQIVPIEYYVEAGEDLSVLVSSTEPGNVQLNGSLIDLETGNASNNPYSDQLYWKWTSNTIECLEQNTEEENENGNLWFENRYSNTTKVVAKKPGIYTLTLGLYEQLEDGTEKVILSDSMVLKVQSTELIVDLGPDLSFTSSMDETISVTTFGELPIEFAPYVYGYYYAWTATSTVDFTRPNDPGSSYEININPIELPGKISLKCQIYEDIAPYGEGPEDNLLGEDTVIINLYPENLPPIVDAGENQIIDLSVASTDGVILNGIVWDDQLSIEDFNSNDSDVQEFYWEPEEYFVDNEQNINNHSLNSVAKFTSAGTYPLTLTANDGVKTVTDSVKIFVSDPANNNIYVDAGDDIELMWPTNQVDLIDASIFPKDKTYDFHWSADYWNGSDWTADNSDNLDERHVRYDTDPVNVLDTVAFFVGPGKYQLTLSNGNEEGDVADSMIVNISEPSGIDLDGPNIDFIATYGSTDLDGAEVTVGDISVTVEAYDQLSKMNRVVLYLDGMVLGETSIPHESYPDKYRIDKSIDSTFLSNGSHDIIAVAYDQLGNKTLSSKSFTKTGNSIAKFEINSKCYDVNGENLDFIGTINDLVTSWTITIYNENGIVDTIIPNVDNTVEEGNNTYINDSSVSVTRADTAWPDGYYYAILSIEGNADTAKVYFKVCLDGPDAEISTNEELGGLNQSNDYDELGDAYFSMTGNFGVRLYGNTPTIIESGLFELYGKATHSTFPTDVRYMIEVYNDSGFYKNVTPGYVVDGFVQNHVGDSGDESFGPIDLTNMPNGLYHITLTVECHGHTKTVDSKFLLSAPLKIGNVKFSQEDVVIPVGGVPLRVLRSYDSLAKDRDGDFGYGWSYSFANLDIELNEYRLDKGNYTTRSGGIFDRDVTLTLPTTGERVTFAFWLDDNTGGPGIENWRVKYKAPDGINATLRTLDGDRLIFGGDIFGGYGVGYYWNDMNSWDTFRPDAGVTPDLTLHDISGYILTLEDGTEYVIERKSYGNHSVIGYSDLEDYSPQYSYQSCGKPYLSKIVMPSGEKVEFVVDTTDGENPICTAVNGYLPNIDTPVKSIHITYDDNNRIKAIYTPQDDVYNSANSTDIASIVYDYDLHGNLISVSKLVYYNDPETSEPKYDTIKYSYTDDNHSTSEHYVTDIKDPRGLSPIRYVYDDEGRLIETIDARGNSIKINHNITGEIETVTDRAGNINVYGYNNRGDVESVKNSEGMITFYVYDDSSVNPHNPIEIWSPLVNNNEAVGPVESERNNYAITTNQYVYTGKTLTQQTVIDPLNNMTDTYYDTNGLMIKTIQLKVEPTEPLTFTEVMTTRNCYDTNQRLIATCQTTGDDSSFTIHSMSLTYYDNSGRLMDTIQINTDYVSSKADLINIFRDGNYNELKSINDLRGDTNLYMAEHSLIHYAYTYDDSDTKFRLQPVKVSLPCPASSDAFVYNQYSHYDANGNQDYSWTFKEGENGNDDKYIFSITDLDALGRPITTRQVIDNDNDPTDGTETILSDTYYNEIGKVECSASYTNCDNGVYKGTATYYGYDELGNSIITWTYALRDRADIPNPQIENLLTISKTVYDESGRTIITVGPYEYPPSGSQAGTKTEYDTLGRVEYTRRYANVDITIEAVDKTGTVLNDNVSGYNKDYMIYRVKSNWTATDEVSRTRTIYDDAGRVDQSIVLDEQGYEQATSYKYDDLGRQIEVTDPGQHTSYTYYDGTRRDYVKDAKGNETHFTYDSLGRVITTQHPPVDIDGIDQGGDNIFEDDYTYTHVGYDGLGRKIWDTEPVIIADHDATDLDAYKKYYDYDIAGRLTKVTLPAVDDPEDSSPDHVNPVYQYFYDNHGNQIAILDAKDRLTVFEYDEFNRQVAKYLPYDASSLADYSVTSIYNSIPANQPCEYMAYDDFGRLLWSQDYKGQITGYSYNSMGQLEYKKYYEYADADGNGENDNYPTNPAEVYAYTYDNLGRQDEISKDGVSQQKFYYDTQGRVHVIDSPQGVIEYGYSSITGRKTTVKTYAVGTAYADIVSGTATPVNSTSYGYDNMGRLDLVKVKKRHSLAVDESTFYTYNEVGSLESIKYPNGNYSYYWYNSYNQLIKLSNFAHYEDDPDNPTGAVLSSYDYSLAADGQRTQAVEVRSGTSRTVQWHYDNLNRVEEEIVVGSYVHTYEYDLAGNRQSITKDGTATYYFYDERDRLDKECSDAEGTTIIVQYGYDDNGSMTSKAITGGDTTSYTYNLQNRLESVTAGSSPTMTYQYDPSGIRSQKAISGGETIDYHIDSQNHTGYAQVLEQTVSDGVNSDQVTFFVIGSDIIGQAVNSSDPTYFLYDGHGSVRQDADETGAVLQSYDYDAYGNAVGFTPTDGLYYCGEMYDTNLNYYYLRARWYNPSNGLFNRLDPFSGNMNDPQSLHKYLYCHGNPVNGIDPSGMEWDNAWIGTEIHKEIADLYILEHQANSVLSNNYSIPGLNANLKPDIMDFTDMTIIEIKPLETRQMAEGVVKLLGYLSACNKSNIPGASNTLAKRWTPGRWGPSLRIIPIPKYPNYCAVILGNVNGLLVYKRFKCSANEMKLLLTAELAREIMNEYDKLTENIGEFGKTAAPVGVLAYLSRQLASLRINQSKNMSRNVGTMIGVSMAAYFGARITISTYSRGFI